MTREYYQSTTPNILWLNFWECHKLTSLFWLSKLKTSWSDCSGISSETTTRNILHSIKNPHLIFIKLYPWTWSHLQIVLGGLIKLVGRHFIIQRRVFWLGNISWVHVGWRWFLCFYLNGRIITEKRPRSILGTRTFLDIYIHFISIGRRSSYTIRIKYFFPFWFP